MTQKLILFLSILLLTACAYTPKQITYYDKECGVVSKKFIIHEEKIGLIPTGLQCTNDKCREVFLATILGSAFVGTISAIISGTIVITGNTIYWLEKQTNCQEITE